MAYPPAKQAYSASEKARTMQEKNDDFEIPRVFVEAPKKQEVMQFEI